MDRRGIERFMRKGSFAVLLASGKRAGVEWMVNIRFSTPGSTSA
jgi:hypothetical protein